MRLHVDFLPDGWAYGPRIFLPLSAPASQHAHLAKFSSWGGSDKRQSIDGYECAGYEFPSRARLVESLASLPPLIPSEN